MTWLQSLPTERSGKSRKDSTTSADPKQACAPGSRCGSSGASSERRRSGTRESRSRAEAEKLLRLRSLIRACLTELAKNDPTFAACLANKRKSLVKCCWYLLDITRVGTWTDSQICKLAEMYYRSAVPGPETEPAEYHRKKDEVMAAYERAAERKQKSIENHGAETERDTQGNIHQP